MKTKTTFREMLINPSYRRRPVSRTLNPLDSGIRQNDGKKTDPGFLGAFAITVALLLTSSVLMAEDQPRQFDIELLIFENLVAGDNGEVWPVDYSEWFEESVDAETPQPAATEQRQWLSGQQLQMTAKYNALRKSSRYRPLAHFAWRQAVLDRQQAQAFEIPVENTSGSYVDGSVRIAVERYLHLYLDLQLHPAPQQTISEADTFEFDLPDIRLTEQRRMRSKEVHYFDNPRFGVIALITPYKLPKPVETTAPDTPAVEQP